MAFDYKKEYKGLYVPSRKPVIVEVPPMRFAAIRGKGDPNDEDGDYKRSIDLLYGIAYAVKMGGKGGRKTEGYFDFVVPPLEGLWVQKGNQGIDHSRKEDLEWISMIRMPDFVDDDGFSWAVEEASRKKEGDFYKAELLVYDEGTCVQCMHVGSYDDEPATIGAMHRLMEQEGYALDVSEQRPHHEIYLSDARRTPPEKLKTVIRHPVRPDAPRCDIQDLAFTAEESHAGVPSSELRIAARIVHIPGESASLDVIVAAPVESAPVPIGPQYHGSATYGTRHPDLISAGGASWKHLFEEV